MQAKPKVAIIGEFWAMSTEGDGNYQLQRFLESEGAEVDVQLISAWLLYMVWQGRFDTQSRANLRGADDHRSGLADVHVRKKLAKLYAADRVVRIMFQTVAHSMGLYGYHLPDMDLIAEISAAFYDNKLRGGEGHMEVGKVIQNVVNNKVNLTLSVKPFGCMPSSSVSDGVQSLITELYPDGIFLPIETTGDGAVNVYSRVQMQLFKAKQAAACEVNQALATHRISMEDVRAYLGEHPRIAHAFHKSPHEGGCTTADLIAEVGARRYRARYLMGQIAQLWTARSETRKANAHLRHTAQVAAAKMQTHPAVIESDHEPRPTTRRGKALRVLN